MKQERKIFHVYVKCSKIDYYFGSMKAIFSTLNKDCIGIQYQSLVSYFHTNDTGLYENTKCFIRKGVLITQATKRGRKNIKKAD